LVFWSLKAQVKLGCIIVIVLITGANGMLGERCTLQLSRVHDVIASDLGNQLLYPSCVNYRQLDITDKKAVIGFMEQLRPQVLLNCAAFTHVDDAERRQNLAYKGNVQGVANIIEAVLPFGTHVIQISTDYVFDGSAGPYKETDKITPINYYGETKYMSEQLLIESGITNTIIRTNVLFGSSNAVHASFVHWVISKLQNREKISVVNDQYGNPTWVNGLAEVIKLIIERKVYGIYHYGGADYVNRFELALETASVFNLDPTLIRPTTTRALAQIAPRPFRSGLKCDKIIKELGITLYRIKDALTLMKGQL
jgi:dTDP-4-dehydrorhamnose reductase